MPTYDYHCKHCGKKIEKLHNMLYTLPVKCPRCGKNMKKLISTTASIKLIGEGFYCNDYKKGMDDE